MAATVAALVSISDLISPHSFSSCTVVAGETTLIPTVHRRRKTYTSTAVGTLP